MTQDPYGQGQGAGSVARGDVVPNDDADESQGEQTAPATHFQKVAPSPDAPAGLDGPDLTHSGEAETVSSPDAADRDRVTGTEAGVPAEPEPRPDQAEGARSDFSDLAYGSLLPDASEFQQRWRQVQFRFVDDPQGSVTEAAEVIERVAAKLESAITERQRSLRARWSEGTGGDTETLRATLLMTARSSTSSRGPGS